jgi:hypothetical protein
VKRGDWREEYQSTDLHPNMTIHEMQNPQGMTRPVSESGTQKSGKRRYVGRLLVEIAIVALLVGPLTYSLGEIPALIAGCLFGCVGPITAYYANNPDINRIWGGVFLGTAFGLLSGIYDRETLDPSLRTGS